MTKCVLFVGEEEQTEWHDFPFFRSPGNTGSWGQQHRQTPFSSPREHRILVWFSSISKARQCENQLRGVRSIRRPVSRAFVWVRNIREWSLSLCGSATTPNTGWWACRLFSGAMLFPPQGICHWTNEEVVVFGAFDPT
ncbi:unnamed protein product [Ascophyllum nodosum]